MKKFKILLIVLVIIGVYLGYHRVGEIGAVPQGIYPDKSLTPGVTNPLVTQANINQTICKAGWTKTIRPPSSYTTKLKMEQTHTASSSTLILAEEDHLISLELGGDPVDPKNLWPESYTPPGAREKDRTENELNKEVCNGTITLKEAQYIISTDWYSFYLRKVKGKFGSVDDVDEDDE